MVAAPTLRSFRVEEALSLVDGGACLVDLRETDTYLDVHIPGSIALLYESGPGFNSRARDCIPLEVPLILLDLGTGDVRQAAAALRGKGFDVRGALEDGINAWAAGRGTPASTEVVYERPEMTILDVGDPGAQNVEADHRISIERLWERAGEVTAERVAVAAGFGVRAAIAVGILERAQKDVTFWRTRR